MAKKPTKAQVDSILDKLSASEIESLVKAKRKREAANLEASAKDKWKEIQALEASFADLTDGARFRWLKVGSHAGKKGSSTKEKSGQKRSPRRSDGWYEEKVAVCLKKSSGRTASAKDIREFIAEAGGSAASVSTRILPAMVEKKLLERVDRGQYKLSA